MIVTLAGGVGGAKMSSGFCHAQGSETVTVIVNTADDFDLFGLRICPDIDTVLYTLAGLEDPQTGWGIDGDTHATLGAMQRLGGESWFSIGDQDFATHILRTERLRQGWTLTKVVEDFSDHLGVGATVLPMTNSRVSTVVGTPDGDLDFQDYFVRRQQQDVVTGLTFSGIEDAIPGEQAIVAIEQADLLVICPSNPLVSIGPILGVSGYRQAISESRAPVVAVSPIIAGKALKGPADRMMASTGIDPSAVGVAQLYAGIAVGFVLDNQDGELVQDIEALGYRVLVTDTIMRTIADRIRLAGEIVEFSEQIANVPSGDIR